MGRGSVGLALALALPKKEFSVRLLDRRPPETWRPSEGFDQRVYAFNPSSRELLHSLGAWARLDATRIGHMQDIEVYGDQGGTVRFSGKDAPLAHILEEGAVQQALFDELQAKAPETLLAPAQPESLTILDSHVELKTKEGRTLIASLLVGADGGNSWVRETQGFALKTHDFKQRAIVMTIAFPRPHDSIGRQWFLGGEIIAFLPLPGDRICLVWSTDQETADILSAQGEEAVLQALQHKIGTPLGTGMGLTAPKTFALSDIEVSPLVKPRVALVGDAAHRVHPLAGQGLNLGFGDIVALAEAIQSRGPGPDPGDLSVLRRYARSRQLPLQSMRLATRGLHALFDSTLPGLAFLRNQGLHWVDQWAPLKDWLVASAAHSHRPTKGASP